MSAYAFLGCYIQRFSSTFGINNSPTNVELTLVAGKSTIPVDANGTYTNGIPVTGFDFGRATPGSVTGIAVGNFKYVGIIESYEENYSAAGRTYSVRMTDPRVIFDNIYMVLDGKNSFPTQYITSSGLTNYLDVLHYYENFEDAEITDDGIPFSSIRNFLSTSAYGLIYCWGKPFRVIFDDGFQDLGSINLQGIPNWYRIKESKTTLGSLIQKVASDFNKDWYAYIDWDQYETNPTGIQDLIIKSIERTDASSSTTLETILAGAEASGTLVSYRRGRELRTDPGTVVLHGPPEIQWVIPSTGNTERFWGYDPKYGIALTTPVSSGNGIVLLDHIVGSGTYAEEITSLVTVEGTSYIKLTGPDVYPPIIQPSSVSIQYKGYYPDNDILSASLFSQESWETILFLQDPSFAAQIGVVRPRFLPYDDYIALMATYNSQGVYTSALDTSLINTGSGIDDRDDRRELLINSVYEATRDAASNYYGKAWMVDITPSRRTRPIELPTTAFSGSNLYPKLDFELTDAGWLDPSGSYPDAIDFTEDLYSSNNPVIKNTDGRTRPFMSISSQEFVPLFFDQGVSGPINQTLFDKNSIINLDNIDRLITTINVEPYNLNPHKAIVTTPVSIQPWPLIVESTEEDFNYDTHKAYYEFLRYLDYPRDFIYSNSLLSKAEENSTFGLIPPAAQYIEDDIDNLKGFCIPVASVYDSYGPYMKISPTGGGVTVIDDSSFHPWGYAGIGRMRQAGVQITSSNITQANVLDSASFVLAGEPSYNIGQKITDSATITSLSFQIGADGVTTSYSLRTFALPPFKVSKFLQEQINQSLMDSQSKFRENIDLNEVRNKNKNSGSIFNPNQVETAVKQSNLKGFGSAGSFAALINPSGKQGVLP